MVLAVLFVLAWAACGEPGAGSLDGGPDAGRAYVPEPFEPTPATIAYCARDDAEVEARITAILAQLTPAEKIRMMHGASVALVDGTWYVAGHERLGVPGLRMLDGPRGVSSLSGRTATAFPVGMMRGATWDPALEERVGAAMAREIRAAGADTILAPTINLLRHPRWGRAQETYSEDTHHLGELAVAFVRGVQREGVLASAKHFALNSIENTRLHVDVRIDERSLREVYLPHFRRVVVDARVASIMSAYNSVNGLHCDLNHHLLTDILKGDWQFAGFVESDWILGTHGDVESVRAGLDIEMPAASHFRRLHAALAAGEITEAEIDRSVRRILRAQFCFGLDERTPMVDDAQRETPAHLALAREVARRGIVLLKNEWVDGAPVLPLDASSIDAIVVLGRNATAEAIGDLGSSRVRPTDVVTALEGITARAAGRIAVRHLPGSTLDAAGEAQLRAADVAIVVTGLGAEDEGEGTVAAGDRTSLALPEGEVSLIRAVSAIHPRVIVVLEGGAAITSADWDGDVQALLFAFYPGSEGGHAIAEILFGDAAPSGRLPFSVPVSEADLPVFDNVSPQVTYGYFHGYRHLQHEGIAPHYPFGFGLSYTSFELSDLRLSSDTVGPEGTLEATVHVRNVGAVAGIETVQLYIAARGSALERAPRDLRAFGQIALDPGEGGDLTLSVRAADLAYWDVATSRFVVEPIEYEVQVGRHSEDVALVASFRVE